MRALLPYTTLFARLAVGTIFLSVVADRLGLWGPPGADSVAWGNFERFLDNVRVLNPYLPELLVPAVGWTVTVAEFSFGLLLIVGYKTRWAALLGGLLLLTFAISTAIAFGVKVPLNYSIFVASSAALLLASQDHYPWSLDHALGRSPEPGREA